MRIVPSRHVLPIWFIVLCGMPALLAAGAPSPALAGQVDLAGSVVLVPKDVSGPERQAARMLIEEVEKRTQIRWREVETWPAAANGPVIALGTAASLSPVAGPHSQAVAQPRDFTAAEGFRLRVLGGKSPAVLCIGNDARGVLFAAGRLLRELRMSSGKALVSEALDVQTAPQVALRGHQLGYRPKTNSYDAWTVPMWEQYIRDLAVFGTNAVELVPPRTDDDATSPHFPLPQLEMMVEMSRLLDQYGLDVWIWYPALDADYSNPATVEAALEEWDVVFRSLPRIDAVFVPGGDPGHTHPKHMLPFLEKQAANLRKRHPNAEMWMSPQGFDGEWMNIFLDILRREEPRWLAGVVHGPQVRMSVPEFREAVPKQYKLRMYPDITHSRQCQYPVPNWDLAFAVTEGREGVNPRPVGQARILRGLAAHSNGFISYSEGCNDDVNKIVWSGLGWDLDRPVIDILREYGRYFIGHELADPFAQGLMALERNWEGSLISNHTVETTYLQFQDLEQAAPKLARENWRFQQALYRAAYDAYIRERLLYETALEDQAMQILRGAEYGASKAMDDAERILDRAVTEPVSTGLRSRIFTLGDALNASIRMQLSVERHGAIAAERGANLDTIDTPLNNRPWLKHRFAEIRALADEPARVAALREIVDWTNPGPGGFYDDLGNPARQPHLVPGVGLDRDPDSFLTPRTGWVIGEPYFTIYPRSWLRNAEMLYDGALQMRYEQLDPEASYKLRVAYAGDTTLAKMRLVADEGLEVHPEIVKGRPARKMEFDIPREATRDGVLTLTWRSEQGLGRNGRACQVAEVWLIRQSP